MTLSWEYIAGFFAGEGSISLRHNGAKNMSVGFYPRLTFTQTRERGRSLLNEIQSFLAERSIKSCICANGKDTPKERRCYVLVVSNKRDVTEVLEQTLPYSRIKRTEAQDMLRTLKLFPKISRKQKGVTH